MGGAGRQQGKSGWKDAQATGGAEPADPCPAEEGSHQGPGRVRCLGGSVPARAGWRQCGWEGAGPQDRCPGHPTPTCRAAQGSAQNGQSGATGRAGGWALSVPRPLATPGGPAQELEGVGTRTAGSPHRVADLTLRLGRQPSGPPEPVWGFWKLQFPGSRPANQALSTGKCWEPPLPLAGVGQSSPVLVTRSREFYRKQSGQ